jgi:hypothetical protein
VKKVLKQGILFRLEKRNKNLGSFEVYQSFKIIFGYAQIAKAVYFLISQ